jgi:hypothetical protein
MSVPAPVDLIAPAASSAAQQPPSASWTEYAAHIGTPLLWPLGALAFVVLGVFAWRALRARTPERELDRAFHRVAHKLGLSTMERLAVQRAAAAAGVSSPATLLLSDRALQQAAFAFVRSGADKTERKALDSLMRRRGVIPEDALPAGAVLPRLAGGDADRPKPAPKPRLNAVA